MQKRHQRRMPRRRSHVSSVGSFSGHVYAGQAGSMNHEQHYHHDYTCQYKLRAVVSRTRSRSKHSRLSLGQQASQPRSHPPSHHPPAPLHALAASSSTPPCAERAAVRHPSSHTSLPPHPSIFHVPFLPFPGRPAGHHRPIHPLPSTYIAWVSTAGPRCRCCPLVRTMHRTGGARGLMYLRHHPRERGSVCCRLVAHFDAMCSLISLVRFFPPFPTPSVPACLPVCPNQTPHVH